MPLLEVSRLDIFTFIRVYAVMLHPNDPSKREQLLEFARAQSPLVHDETSPQYLMLDHARSKLVDQTCIKRGLLAGEVLLVLRQIYEFHAGVRRDEPSLAKAIEIVKERYRGSGQASLPKSRSSLEQSAWDKYRSVAHLCSIWRFHEELRRSMEPKKADCFDPTDPETLPVFLALAEDMRRFGERITTRAKKEGNLQKMPILNSATMWQVTLDSLLPSIAVKLPPLSESDLGAYRNYKAKR